MSKKTIYLSKDGQVAGPFSPGEIEALRQSDELYQYQSIWLDKLTGWNPIEEDTENSPDEMPALPPNAPTPPVSMEVNEAKSASEEQAQALEDTEPTITQQYAVLVHNHKAVMSLKLLQLSAQGCLAQSEIFTHHTPTLREGTAAIMNILNQENGHSESVSVQIENFKRGEEFWEYQIAWDKIPSLLD